MEVKYLALPSVSQLRGRSTGRDPQVDEKRLEAYDTAQYRVMLAQRKCAVIAAEFVRPKEHREAQGDYRAACHAARDKFEQACVDIFSETCTKGM